MPDGSSVGGIAADRLRIYVERIERLEEEKRAIAGDIKDVKAEAKSSGFDLPTINTVLKRRRMNTADLREQDELLELYCRALGDFCDTPLGQAMKGDTDDDAASDSDPTPSDTLSAAIAQTEAA